MPLDPTQTVISKIFVHSSSLYVGLADYRVSIINLETYQITGEITENLWEVKSLFVEPNYVYVGSLNETLSIFNNEKRLENQIQHELGVISLDVDSEYIYTGSFDGKVKVWNKNDLSQEGSLDNHIIRVNCISSSESKIYTGDGFTTNQASIQVWAKDGFTTLKTISAPVSKRVNCIEIDSHYIYSGHGGPGEIRIWDKESYSLIKIIKTKYDVKSIAINENQIICSVKDTLKIFNKRDFTLLKEIQENGREVNDCKFFEPYIIYSSRDQIKIIHSNTYENIKTVNLNLQ
ncbi:MAG: hypothetical protein ACW99Q_07065 [Candidatus Kariarchaeaceae archaeon]|jgi:WD40 repeat protein